MARQHKFRAVRTIYNGVSYPSKAEARRAEALDLLWAADEIDFWFGQIVCGR